MRGRPLTFLALAAALASGARPAAGVPALQEPGPLVGRVVDADGGRALSDAEVGLLRVPEGSPVLSAPDSVAAAALDSARAARRTATGEDGVYRFEDVGPGRYLLRVRRAGYRSSLVQVRRVGGDDARVSVALRMEPIALEPLLVRSPGHVEVVSAEGEVLALGRVTAVRHRQATHLGSDVRLVGDAELREAATLGEPDIFRTLQRLPGVATRDDYTAELWTRGASWGETRVYLDGVPLFNPVHGFGVLSGMSHRGLGPALFHPGVRPVDLPGGGAARLDLRSGSGLGLQAFEAGVDVSLASAQGWGRGPLQGGEGGWMLSARRSYVDVVARRVSDEPDERFPYAFSDLSARLDTRPTPSTRLTVSGLWESDEMEDELPDFLHGTRASWGNLAGQATLAFPLAGLRATQSVGGSVYHARVDTFRTRFDDGLNAPSGNPADHRLTHVQLRGSVSGESGAGWRAGYDVVATSSRYEGPEPWPYSRRPPDLPPTSEDGELHRVGVWAEARFVPLPALEVEGGLRVEGGSRTRAGAVELQPRLTARLLVTPDVSLSAGAGRYVQHAQSPAPVGPLLERSLETGRLWLLAGADRAPLESRIGTLGGEAWLGEAWLVSATAYARHTRGVLLPDPTPGLLVQRAPLLPGRVRARGVDLSVRRLAGRATGSIAYSLGRARAEVLGITFPAPSDRRHVLDLTGQAHLGGGWSLAAGYTLATGAPYARTLERTVGASDREAALLVDPFRRRSPSYRSLDVVLDWTHRFGSWTVGGFLQGRNLTGHRNDVTYTHTEEVCPGAFLPDGTCVEGPPVVEDRFTPGIPTLPLLGLRVSFGGR